VWFKYVLCFKPHPAKNALLQSHSHHISFYATRASLYASPWSLLVAYIQRVAEKWTRWTIAS